MRGNIDRINGDYFVIVLENNTILNVKKEQYPDLKTGQIVNIEDNNIIIDEKATKKLKNKIIKLQENLFK